MLSTTVRAYRLTGATLSTPHQDPTSALQVPVTKRTRGIHRIKPPNSQESKSCNINGTWPSGVEAEDRLTQWTLFIPSKVKCKYYYYFPSGNYSGLKLLFKQSFYRQFGSTKATNLNRIQTAMRKRKRIVFYTTNKVKVLVPSISHNEKLSMSLQM